MTVRHEVCPAADLDPGERRIVDVGGRSVGVFNVDGEYYAVRNVCPHQRAPLCEGALTGTVTADAVGEYDWEREGRILRCPWHGWEFDVTSGESVFNPHRWRVSTYEARVEAPAPDDGECDGGERDGGAAGEARSGDVAGERARIAATEQEGVETYPVDVEDGVVVVYV